MGFSRGWERLLCRGKAAVLPDDGPDLMPKPTKFSAAWFSFRWLFWLLGYSRNFGAIPFLVCGMYRF